MRGKLIFLVIQFFGIYGSRAPDIPPNLPDGWCNTQYGTPTRSTGECICKYSCLGNGCQRGQGLIWYEYKSCPSCQCIPGEKIKKPNPVQLETPETIYEEPIETPESQDESTTFLDLLEENSRYIFAGIVTLIVFSLAIFLVFGISSSSNDSNKSTT